ncbi:MAG: STAS domain-containing protein [Spirochaetota bacterium]
MEYKRRQENDFEIFEVSGQFIIGQIGDLFKEYTDLIKENKYKFIFDLTDVKFMDSSGLGTIIMGASHVMKHEEKIRICLDPSNETVKDLFKVVKVDYAVDYYKNIDDAIKGVNKIKL